MNEVETASEKARRAVVAGGSTAGHQMRRLWEWFTDLDFGAFGPAIGLVVGLALGFAVLQGRSGHDPQACELAQPDVDRMSSLVHHARLDSGEVVELEGIADRLDALAAGSHGDDVGVLRYAATAARQAVPGTRLDIVRAEDKLRVACGIT